MEAESFQHLHRNLLSRYANYLMRVTRSDDSPISLIHPYNVLRRKDFNDILVGVIILISQLKGQIHYHGSQGIDGEEADLARKLNKERNLQLLHSRPTLVDILSSLRSYEMSSFIAYSIACSMVMDCPAAQCKLNTYSSIQARSAVNSLSYSMLSWGVR